MTDYVGWSIGIVGVVVGLIGILESRRSARRLERLQDRIRQPLGDWQNSAVSIRDQKQRYDERKHASTHSTKEQLSDAEATIAGMEAVGGRLFNSIDDMRRELGFVRGEDGSRAGLRDKS
jgi:hypothetical protein